NPITVRVTDDGSPALSDARTFNVIVGDYLEVSLGTATVLAGTTGCVSVVVQSSTPVVRLTFEVDPPVPGLTDFKLRSESFFVSAALQTIGLDRWEVSLQALPGQFLLGTQTVASLCFRAVPGRPSAFIPLRVSSISAVQAGQGVAPRALGHDGRVVLI